MKKTNYKVQYSLYLKQLLVFVFSIVLVISIFDRTEAQSLITGLNNKEEFDSLVLSISNPLYNLNFAETEKRINNLKRRIPDHPIIDLLYAINVSWQSLPEPLPEKFDIIKTYLENSIEKSELWLEKEPDSPEPIFFLLMSHGLLAQYYNEQGSTFKTMSEAKRAYNKILRGFELKEQYNEFLFSCGLYNYYIERYPQLYPAYKPFTWLFRSGDITKGLQQLDSARKVTVLARVESAHYLAYIYLRYENQPRKAINVLVPLVPEFPGNLYFKLLLLEAYTDVGKLAQVSDMIDDLSTSSRNYYKLCGNSYKGVLYEKYKFDDILAAKYFNEAINITEKLFSRDVHSLGIAYAGLARISARKKQMKEAREYYKLSLKYTDTESLRQEAKSFLKEN